MYGMVWYNPKEDLFFPVNCWQSCLGWLQELLVFVLTLFYRVNVCDSDRWPREGLHWLRECRNSMVSQKPRARNEEKGRNKNSTSESLSASSPKCIIEGLDSINNYKIILPFSISSLYFMLLSSTFSFPCHSNQPKKTTSRSAIDSFLYSSWRYEVSCIIIILPTLD